MRATHVLVSTADFGCMYPDLGHWTKHAPVSMKRMFMKPRRFWWDHECFSVNTMILYLLFLDFWDIMLDWLIQLGDGNADGLPRPVAITSWYDKLTSNVASLPSRKRSPSEWSLSHQNWFAQFPTEEAAACIDQYCNCTCKYESLVRAHGNFIFELIRLDRQDAYCEETLCIARRCRLRASRCMWIRPLAR